jgi:hypothetical protein
MAILHLLGLPVTLALVSGAATGGVALTDASSHAADRTSQPTLVGIRAAHHPGFDRMVFVFRGGLPAHESARYVDRLIADGSGDVVRVAGRAILQVRLGNARAHTDSGAPTVPARVAFALPNVMTTVRSGDFEGVVTYGIGLAKHTRFDVFTLRRPARVVVDVHAAFRTTERKVWFFDQRNFSDGNKPYFVPRLRPVIPTAPVTGLLDRLFGGVLPAERADGLRLLRSRATGFVIRSIRHGVARLRLTGGCSSGGSTVTIADEIIPTLRHLPTVEWVKIYGPAGHTEHPFGHRDSIPACLEP